MSVVSSLQKKIYNMSSGMFATWMPDESPTIGDYGYLSKGRFVREGNLATRGIKFEEFSEPKKSGSFQYSDGVAFDVGASASARSDLAEASSELNLKFSKQGAFVYHSDDAKQIKISDKPDFYRQLFHAVVNEKTIAWQDGYVIVDEVKTCGCSTILISETKEGEVSVSGKGNIDIADNLANAEGKLEFRAKSGGILNYSGRSDTKPMYHAIKPIIPQGPTGGGGGPTGLNGLLERLKEMFPLGFPKPLKIELAKYDTSQPHDEIEMSVSVGEIGHNETFTVSFQNVGIEELIDSDGLEHEDDFNEVEEVILYEEKTRYGQA